MWDLIVSVPDHCLSFYFEILKTSVRSISTGKVAFSFYTQHHLSIRDVLSGRSKISK